MGRVRDGRAPAHTSGVGGRRRGREVGEEGGGRGEDGGAPEEAFACAVEGGGRFWGGGQVGAEDL